jgi:hypothetical protein
MTWPDFIYSPLLPLAFAWAAGFGAAPGVGCWLGRQQRRNGR